MNLAAMAGEFYQLGDLPRDLQEGLSSPIPQLSKIQELLILLFLSSE